MNSVVAEDEDRFRRIQRVRRDLTLEETGPAAIEKSPVL